MCLHCNIIVATWLFQGEVEVDFGGGDFTCSGYIVAVRRCIFRLQIYKKKLEKSVSATI